MIFPAVKSPDDMRSFKSWRLDFQILLEKRKGQFYGQVRIIMEQILDLGSMSEKKKKNWRPTISSFSTLVACRYVSSMATRKSACPLYRQILSSLSGKSQLLIYRFHNRSSFGKTGGSLNRYLSTKIFGTPHHTSLKPHHNTLT